MGLKLCSDCKREKPKIEDVNYSSLLEEDNSKACIYNPSKEELKTQFSSVTVKPPKLAQLNIEILAGNTNSANNSGGNITSEIPESPAHRLPRGRSLRQKLNERKLINSCPQTPLGYYDEEERQGEKEAKFYIDTLEDNTLTHAQEANSLTESMVNKGARIAAELRREGEVIMKANRDMINAENEINQTRHTLNGMTLHGKIANYWRRKPKPTEYPVDNEREPDYLPRSLSLPAKFAYKYRSSPADTKQQQIKDSVKQMIFNIDTLREQNEGIAEEIMFQEPHLQLMSDNMNRVQSEIVRQTTRINEMH